MANENLKSLIEENIKVNGKQEITADVLQSVLVGMVDALGSGATFMGAASTGTNPGTPDGRVFYVALAPGTYTYFGGLSVTAPSVLYNNSGSWQKLALQDASAVKYLTQSWGGMTIPMAVSFVNATSVSLSTETTTFKGLEYYNVLMDNIPTFLYVQGENWPLHQKGLYNLNGGNRNVCLKGVGLSYNRALRIYTDMDELGSISASVNIEKNTATYGDITCNLFTVRLKSGMPSMTDVVFSMPRYYHIYRVEVLNYSQLKTSLTRFDGEVYAIVEKFEDSEIADGSVTMEKLSTEVQARINGADGVNVREYIGNSDAIMPFSGNYYWEDGGIKIPVVTRRLNVGADDFYIYAGITNMDAREDCFIRIYEFAEQENGFQYNRTYEAEDYPSWLVKLFGGLADNSVTYKKLAPDAVQAKHIAAKAVTKVKLSDELVGNINQINNIIKALQDVYYLAERPNLPMTIETAGITDLYTLLNGNTLKDTNGTIEYTFTYNINGAGDVTETLSQVFDSVHAFTFHVDAANIPSPHIRFSLASSYATLSTDVDNVKIIDFSIKINGKQILFV